MKSQTKVIEIVSWQNTVVPIILIRYIAFRWGGKRAKQKQSRRSISEQRKSLKEPMRAHIKKNAPSVKRGKTHLAFDWLKFQ